MAQVFVMRHFRVLNISFFQQQPLRSHATAAGTGTGGAAVAVLVDLDHAIGEVLYSGLEDGFG